MRYLIVLLIVIASACQKDVEPDLADPFVGSFFLDKSVYKVEWRISKKDANHVDILLKATSTAGGTAGAEYVALSTIDNVLVKSPSLLQFDNQMQQNGSIGKVTGLAELTGDIISYDIDFTYPDGTIESGAEKIYRKP